MPLNPPPTIEIGLGLVVQPLKRADQSRSAEITYALNCAGVPSAAVAQDSIDDFQAAFNAAFGPFFDTDVTILKPKIRSLAGFDHQHRQIVAGHDRGNPLQRGQNHAANHAAVP